MGNETSKAYQRRLDSGYFDKYLIGHGIDIGCGSDVLYSPHDFQCDSWDIPQGDAQGMHGVKDEVYDFVYSSHCLEHLVNPIMALQNWWRILKPEGYLFLVVPDEDLYEQRVWPSRGNGDHKTTWTIFKPKGYSWSPVSHNIIEDIMYLPYAQIVSIQLLDFNYDYKLVENKWIDQTGIAEVGIECIIKKRILSKFDEQYYLDNNPDVAESIRRTGWPKSGYSHYIEHGCHENRLVRWTK